MRKTNPGKLAAVRGGRDNKTGMQIIPRTEPHIKLVGTWALVAAIFKQAGPR